MIFRQFEIVIESHEYLSANIGEILSLPKEQGIPNSVSWSLSVIASTQYSVIAIGRDIALFSDLPRFFCLKTQSIQPGWSSGMIRA